LMSFCPIQFFVKYFEKMTLEQKFDTWRQVLDLDPANNILNDRMSDILSMSKSGLSASECVDKPSPEPRLCRPRF